MNQPIIRDTETTTCLFERTWYFQQSQLQIYTSGVKRCLNVASVYFLFRKVNLKPSKGLCELPCVHMHLLRGRMRSASLGKQLKGAAYLPILRMHEGNWASFSASLYNLTMAWFIYMGVKLFVLSRLWYLTGEWERIETTSRQFEILISAPPTAVFMRMEQTWNETN